MNYQKENSLGSEKMADEHSIRPKTFKKRLENFWYHYKWQTIISAVLLVTVVIGLYQCFSREHYDYRIVLATSTVEISPAQTSALSKEIEKYAKDIDGDGKVSVSVIECSFNANSTAYGMIMAKKQKLQSIIMNEQDMLVFITDKESYEWIESINKNGIFENTGLEKDGGKYFDLTDTEFLKNVKQNCADTVIWPETLRISRRRVKDTLIENNKNVETYMEISDALIKNIAKKTVNYFGKDKINYVRTFQMEYN